MSSDFKLNERVRVYRQVGKKGKLSLVSGTIIKLPRTIRINDEPAALIKYDRVEGEHPHAFSTIQKMKKRGGIKGVPHPSHRKKPRTDIKLKAIKLDANQSFATQLKHYRVIMNYSLREIGEKIGFHPSNLHHYENNNGPFKSTLNQLTETAIKYAKALGVETIEITL